LGIYDIFMMQLEVLQIDAKDTWPLRHRVMWPDKPQAYVVLPNDEEGVHFGMKEGNNLIAVVSLFIEGNQAQFRKLATETALQGQGHGSALLTHLFSFAEKLPISRLWCNARADKITYYEKFGMRKTAKKFNKGGISYVIMEKLLTKNT